MCVDDPLGAIFPIVSQCCLCGLDCVELNINVAGSAMCRTDILVLELPLCQRLLITAIVLLFSLMPNGYKLSAQVSWQVAACLAQRLPLLLSRKPFQIPVLVLGAASLERPVCKIVPHIAPELLRTLLVLAALHLLRKTDLAK